MVWALSSVHTTIKRYSTRVNVTHGDGEWRDGYGTQMRNRPTTNAIGEHYSIWGCLQNELVLLDMVISFSGTTIYTHSR